jgi:oligoendopeptidase F
LYYIDYCLAQSCALQYKAWMDEDYEKAWESYLTLCRLSASDFYTNMIKEVGLDSPFEEQSMQKLVQKMEQKLWNE